MKDSVHKKILEILSQNLNFTYRLIDAKEIWASFKNGVWLGSVGQVYNKVIGFASTDCPKETIRDW